MQHFLGDPEYGLLNLETHHLALAIAKKTLEETSSGLPKEPWIENQHPSK